MIILDQLEFNSFIHMQAALNKMKGIPLTPEESDQLIIRDIMEQLVANVPVKQGGPFNEKVTARNGYSVWEGNYIGRYAIQVTRLKDNFYMSVGVRYSGSINRIKTGYYLVGTNGTIEDVEDAIQSSSDYW